MPDSSSSSSDSGSDHKSVYHSLPPQDRAEQPKGKNKKRQRKVRPSSQPGYLELNEATATEDGYQTLAPRTADGHDGDEQYKSLPPRAEKRKRKKKVRHLPSICEPQWY